MHQVEIIQIRQETPTVKSFRLALPAPTFSFWPGQWVDLYIADPTEGPNGIIGGFSITSSPLHRDYIDLAIKRIPEGRASVHFGTTAASCSPGASWTTPCPRRPRCLGSPWTG